MVLEKDSRTLPERLLPVRAFVGGPVGPGTQWVSWIHRADLADLMEWVLSTPTVSGPVNAVAPSPVAMREFCATLGRVLRLALGELAMVLTMG